VSAAFDGGSGRRSYKLYPTSTTVYGLTRELAEKRLKCDDFERYYLSRAKTSSGIDLYHDSGEGP